MKPRPKTKILALLLALCLALGGMPLTAWAGDETQNSGAEGNITAFAEVAGDVVAKNSDNTAASSQFSDVADSDINLLYINYINAREIMAGFPDGSFRPEEGLTRAQAAVVISKAAHLETGPAGDSSFNDVGSQHWAAGYIAAAVKAGYLQGMGDGSYRPDQPLSRAQAISLIMGMSRQEDSRAALPALSDMDGEHWAARSMAMAIDAGMIVPQDNNIQPEQNITRGDICRALAVLLTGDPELAVRPLYGALQVKSGEVKVSRAGQEAVTVSGSSQVGTGDTIETSAGAAAEINYPDGSSLFLKAGSKLTIKESQGRAYIKQDGRSGAAVDNLRVELQTGALFGALSSLALPGSAEAEAEQADGEPPWYKTAYKEKVKVTVDMPWGVAAIRGSFWQNTVNSNGSGFITLLEGNAAVTSAGQTVSLSPGQAASVSTPGQPPSAPAPMTAGQLSQWAQQQNWVRNTFDNMSQNQGSPAPGAPAENNNAIAPAPSLEKALNQALEQAQKAADSIPKSSSGGSSRNSGGNGGNSGNGNNGGNGGNGGETTEITATIDLPRDIYLPQQAMNPDTGLLEDNAGVSFALECNVPGVTVAVTNADGTPVTQPLYFDYDYNQNADQITFTPQAGATGYNYMLYLTLSKEGCTSWTSDDPFYLRTLPVVEPLNGYAAAGYSAPFTVGVPGNWSSSTLFDSSWTNKTEYVEHTHQSGFHNLTIAPGLPAGLYYILLQDSYYNRAVAPLLVRPEAAGDFFKLNKVVMNRDNDTVYGSVYQGDSLSFIFDEGIDSASLSQPLQELLGATGTADFAGLGLGSFVSTFTGTFGETYQFDDTVKVTRASLTDNSRVLTLAFTRGAFANLASNNYDFIASGGIRSTGGQWMDDDPVIPALVRVHEESTLSGNVYGYVNKDIGSSMPVRFWYAPGSYLQDDGSWGPNAEEFTATLDLGSYSVWQVENISTYHTPPAGADIYCDVQIDGEWLNNIGQLRQW